MARTYKWLGGIGYILQFVPYVNAVSSILVAIAWILMGRDTKENIFTVLGILMLVMFALSIGFIAWMILSLMAMGFTVGAMTMPGMMQPGQILGQLWGIIAFAIIILALALISFILDIVAHFRAGRIFDNRWFRLAGWMRIGLIIALVIAIPLIIFSIISAGPGILSSLPAPTQFSFGAILSVLFSILWPLTIVFIVGLLAIIFSIIAFFTIPEEAPPPPPPPQETPASQ